LNEYFAISIPYTDRLIQKIQPIQNPKYC
jgi:hypothetical protein